MLSSMKKPEPTVLMLISVFLLLEIDSIQGRFFCFRRMKKKGTCGGLLRLDRFSNFESCCGGRGQGFADTKVQMGKNRFSCTPCSQAVNRRPTSLSLSTTSTIEPTPETTTEFDWPAPPKREFIVPPENIPEDELGRPIAWEEWSPCSTSCGAGWRSRAKMCDQCDRNDYQNVQSQPCMVNFHCPVDGSWGPWFPWEACSSVCNGGTRTRQRKCNYPPPANGGQPCPGDSVAVQECKKQPCPVDGIWGEWTEFSQCSSACGPGTIRRTRRCDSPVPEFGGKDCPGVARETKKCEAMKCPVDGSWSLWSSWTLCSATCGKGSRERSRQCDSPRPQFDGHECQGSAVQHEECYSGQHCPVDGQWSAWSSFSYCRAPGCGQGHQVRSRTCSNPAPSFGGKPCMGLQQERKLCWNDKDCPKNGSWCPWSEWNSCSSSCRESSLQGRQRVCACPAPAHGGQECQGDSFQVQVCNHLPACGHTGQLSIDTSSATEASRISNHSFKVSHQTTADPDPAEALAASSKHRDSPAEPHP